MKKFKILLIMLGMLVFFGGTSTVTAADSIPLILGEGVYQYENARQALKELNARRSAKDLTPLTEDGELTEAAMKRAAELHFYYSHMRPNGQAYGTVSEKRAVSGEICGIGDGNAKGIVKDWIKDEGNARHVYYEKYRSAGVGSFTQGGYTYWVVLFGGEEGIPAKAKENQKVRPQISVRGDVLKLNLADTGRSFRQGKANQFQVTAVNQGYPTDSVNLAAENFNWSYSNPRAITLYTNGSAVFNQGGKTNVTAGLKAAPSYKIAREITARMDISTLTMPVLTDVVYTGKAQKPKVQLEYKGTALKKNRDFTVSYFRNKSVGTARVLIEGKGNYVGAKSLSFDIVPRLSNPSAPRVQAEAVSYNRVKLSWDPVSGAAGYVIYRKAPGEKYQEIKILPAKKTSYTDKRLVFQQEYKYRVKAYRQSGTVKFFSKNSKTVRATPDIQSPQLSVRAKAGRHILTWEKVGGIDGYLLYRKTGKGKYQAEAVLSAAKTRYTIGTEKNKSYKYKLIPYYLKEGKAQKGPASKVIKIQGK